MSKKKTLPKAPQNEGVDPLTRTPTMYGGENVKEASAELAAANEKEAAKAQEEAAKRGPEDLTENEKLAAAGRRPVEEVDHTETEDPGDTVVTDDTNYAGMTVTELMAMAEERGLEGFKTMKKDDLVAFLENNPAPTNDES